MAFNVVLGIGEHFAKLRDEEIYMTSCLTTFPFQTMLTQALRYFGELVINLAVIQNGVNGLYMFTNNITLLYMSIKLH